MQVSVEKLSEIKRRLTIVIPASQIEEAYTSKINHFVQTSKIKGFRPGKAPKSFIQQRYGEEARQEAYLDVMKGALHDALEENNLNPVSVPEIAPKKTEVKESFEFVVSFEVLPQISEIKFEMENIEQLNVSITQEDIDLVVEQLKKQYTKWHLVDRDVKEKDKVVIDYYTIIDGTPDMDNKVTNFPLEIGSSMMIPGFETGLIGAKIDEERKIQIRFPEDFSIAARAGKEATFVITVKQIFEAELPSVDANFIKDLGIASGEYDDLVKQIKQSLEIEKNRLIRERQKEKIFDVLIEKNTIEIPDALIAEEAKVIHDEIHSHEKDHKHSSEEDTAYRELAKKRVMLGLLMRQYAKQNNLKVDKDKVNKRIEEISSIYEKPEEVITWLSSNERLSQVEAQVLEDQLVEKLLESIPVIERNLSFAELKNIKLTVPAS